MNHGCAMAFSGKPLSPHVEYHHSVLNLHGNLYDKLTLVASDDDKECDSDSDRHGNQVVVLRCKWRCPTWVRSPLRSARSRLRPPPSALRSNGRCGPHGHYRSFTTGDIHEFLRKNDQIRSLRACGVSFHLEIAAK